MKLLKQSYVNEFREIFVEWYEREKETAYYWTGKDGKHCKELSNKILFLIKSGEQKKGNEILPDNQYHDRIIQGFQFILSVCRNDNVVDEHLSISVINSRFNQVIAKRNNNGKSTKQQKRESDLRGFSLSNV